MSSSSQPWRRRLSELGRGTGKAHPPLFAPLLYGVAAQIEALSPAEVTADPTRLGKCLTELRRALGTSPIVTAAPTAMEAEALGATVDRETWPPRVTAPAHGSVLSMAEFDHAWPKSEALAASIETTRRLSTTLSGEPAFIAALTGPSSLLAELLGADATPTGEAWEFAGRALSSLSRRFAQAGVSALVLCERRLPISTEGWSGALLTISNIARFHRIPVLLTFDGPAATEWPASAVPCPPEEGVGAMTKPHGLTVPADPSAWTDLAGRTGGARIVLTASEVPADTSIETLTDACEAALALERDG